MGAGGLLGLRAIAGAFQSSQGDGGIAITAQPGLREREVTPVAGCQTQPVFGMSPLQEEVRVLGLALYEIGCPTVGGIEGDGCVGVAGLVEANLPDLRQRPAVAGEGRVRQVAGVERTEMSQRLVTDGVE